MYLQNTFKPHGPHLWEIEDSQHSSTAATTFEKLKIHNIQDTWPPLSRNRRFTRFKATRPPLLRNWRFTTFMPHGHHFWEATFKPCSHHFWEIEDSQHSSTAATTFEKLKIHNIQVTTFNKSKINNIQAMWPVYLMQNTFKTWGHRCTCCILDFILGW